MKRLIVFLMVFLSTSIVPSQDKDFSYSIKNKQKLVTGQEGAYWCWAASLEAMEKYYDGNIKQEDVIREFYNEPFLTNSYLNKNSYYYSLDFNSINDFEKRFLSKYKSIKFEEIRQNILEDKPIYLMYQRHVLIITGFKFKKNIIVYEIMDPYFTQNNKIPVFGYYPSVSLRYRYGGFDSILYVRK